MIPTTADRQKVRESPGKPGILSRAGVYGNRTHWGRCSHPPLVLKTRAGTSRANTPESERTHCRVFGTAEKTGFPRIPGWLSRHAEERHRRPSRAISSPAADKRTTSKRQADQRQPAEKIARAFAGHHQPGDSRASISVI